MTPEAARDRLRYWYRHPFRFASHGDDHALWINDLVACILALTVKGGEAPDPVSRVLPGEASESAAATGMPNPRPPVAPPPVSPPAGGARPQYASRDELVRSLVQQLALADALAAAVADVLAWTDPYAVPGCERNKVSYDNAQAALAAYRAARKETK